MQLTQQASRPREFHPRALPEPCMTLSSHTAPDVRPLPWCSGCASGSTIPCGWALPSGYLLWAPSAVCWDFRRVPWLDTWRRYFKDRLARVINIAREEAPDLLVFYHCDCDFTRLLPDLVDIGVNVINPVQPDCMDGVAIKHEFGNRLAMWGTVGSALLWDLGTPDQIRTEVRRCIQTLGPQGLLLAPAYDIDFAPFENIVAFVESVEAFGRI